MPELPTLTVSQAHFDRIVAAFPGATLAEKAANYKKWLMNNLISEVEMAESLRIDSELVDERRTRMEAIRASLPPRQTYPPATPAL